VGGRLPGNLPIQMPTLWDSIAGTGRREGCVHVYNCYDGVSKIRPSRDYRWETALHSSDLPVPGTESYDKNQ
jgi:hypothetical protein